MKKIGSILTKRPQNKTLQNIYFQHLCTKALKETLDELNLPGSPLEILPKQQNNTIDYHIHSPNKLLVTHLKTHAMHIQETILTKIQSTVSPSIHKVELKFRLN